MNLAPCPNCSSLSPMLESPVINRPELVMGSKTRKWFIRSCCLFSSRSIRSYETEVDAAEAWTHYRRAMAEKYAQQGFPRLKEAIAALDEYEGCRFAKRVKSTPPTQVSAPVKNVTPQTKPAAKRVPQEARRAPAAATEIYNAQPTLL